MKTIILYSTKYGTSEECAHILSEKLTGEVFIVNLKKNKSADLSEFDRIIIGGSIYAGQIQPEVKSFCTKNINILKSKPLGLYIACMSDDNNSIKTALENAFSADLVVHAAVAMAFGGKFQMKKLNFFEKMIVKMVTKKSAESGQSAVTYDGKTDISTLSADKISDFAEKINSVQI